VAVVALQLPAEKINAIVQRRDGMGSKGESYVVGRLDGQTAYRSDRVIKEGKLGQPRAGKAIEKALSGNNSIDVTEGSTGKLELTAWTPLSIPGLEWCLISNEDIEEVLAPKLEGEEKDFYAKYIEEYGYYDLFLIAPNGDCFYTACREADYGTNLVDGKYASSGLGKLVRKVLQTKKYAVADFEPYAPSNGDPCAFIAQPILYEGNVELVVALQLPLEAINAIMQQRAGMGETGETYLVGQDKLMRSDSFLDKQGHSVAASFSGTVDKNGVDTEAAREALAGKTDAKIITDYNGSPVLSAFAPVDIGGTTWAVIAEIDEAEAFAAVKSLGWLTTVIGIIGVISIVVVGLLAANSIAKPINQVIANLTTGAEQTTSAAGQVSAASQSLAQGSSEQAASLEETTASMEEMASMTNQNADNANEAKKLAETAWSSAEKGTDAMTRMSSAIDDRYQAVVRRNRQDHQDH